MIVISTSKSSSSSVGDSDIDDILAVEMLRAKKEREELALEQAKKDVARHMLMKVHAQQNFDDYIDAVTMYRQQSCKILKIKKLMII